MIAAAARHAIPVKNIVGIVAEIIAHRSISVSLDDGLLAELDAEGGNRSTLVGEAIAFWLAHRRLAALNKAYADLAQLEGGDLAAAGVAASAMALAGAWAA